MNSANGNEVMSGPEEGESYEDGGPHLYETCLPLGPYTFTIYDDNGDGIWFEHGKVNYTLTVIDTVLRQSGVSLEEESIK